MWLDEAILSVTRPREQRERADLPFPQTLTTENVQQQNMSHIGKRNGGKTNDCST